MTEALKLTSPAGRIVAGSVFDGYDMKYGGKEKNPPGADGQPRKDYTLVVAFPKSDPATVEMVRKIEALAQAVWAPRFGGYQPWGFMAKQPAGFHWKITDGDSVLPDQNAVRPVDKTGYAGHFVIAFKRPGSPPTAYDSQGQEIIDAKMIQRGYWVQVAFDVKSNDNEMNAGLYITQRGVKLVGIDTVIAGAISHDEAFGDTPVQLPAHVQAATAGVPAPMPGAPPPQAHVPAAAPMPGVPTATAPAPNFGAAMPPVAAPMPGAPAAMPPAAPPAAMPPPPPPAAVAPPAVAVQMAPGVEGTVDQWMANGWTLDMLRQHGKVI